MDWLSPKEAARAAGVSRQAVYNWIASNQVAAYATERGCLVSAAELERLIVLRQAAGALGKRRRTLAQWAVTGVGGKPPE